MSIVLEFKCKPKNGVIKRPELTAEHVVSGGPFNSSQFMLFLRKLFAANPEFKLPRELRMDDLPTFVSVDETEFMTKVTIDYRCEK